MTFRFIHTADWQVGKPFGQFPAETAFALRQQRIAAVRAVGALAREHAVDAVLVAGDAFDSNAVADRTVIHTVDALDAYAGPWVFLPGNHDAALGHSVWSRLRAMQPPTNAVIADEPVPLDLWEGRAILLPAPLRRRHEPDDLTRWFAEAPSPAGALRLGLAHGSLANRLPGTSEAANAIAEDRAEQAGLDYLALGDWHGALPIAERTYYSGTPEPDRHKANDAGSVYLVEIDGPSAPPRVTSLKVGRYAWVRQEIELLDGTCDRVADALAALPCPRDTVLALGLSGPVTLAERHRLERLVAQWTPRLLHLDLDEAGLRDEPTADDLDAVDTAGFVRLAVDRLRARAADPADPEREAARLALRMIYLDHLAEKP